MPRTQPPGFPRPRAWGARDSINPGLWCVTPCTNTDQQSDGPRRDGAFLRLFLRQDVVLLGAAESYCDRRGDRVGPTGGLDYEDSERPNSRPRGSSRSDTMHTCSHGKLSTAIADEIIAPEERESSSTVMARISCRRRRFEEVEEVGHSCRVGFLVCPAFGGEIVGGAAAVHSQESIARNPVRGDGGVCIFVMGTEPSGKPCPDAEVVGVTLLLLLWLCPNLFGVARLDNNKQTVLLFSRSIEHLRPQTLQLGHGHFKRTPVSDGSSVSIRGIPRRLGLLQDIGQSDPV